MELLAKDPGRNLAQGAPTISSGFFVKGGTGSVTDMDYNSRMQLSLTGSEWYVGFEYAGNAVQTIGAIRISTGATDTTTWSWRDFHAEYEDAGGNWIDLGQASIPAGQSNYWVDLGGTVNARGVRLYASTAFANAPTAQDVVDEIMVFAPEPASLSLFALSGLVLLRRRK